MLPLAMRYIHRSWFSAAAATTTTIATQHYHSCCCISTNFASIIINNSLLSSSSSQQQQYRYFSDEGPKTRIIKKVSKKVKKKNDTGRSRDLQILLDCLDAPKAKPPLPDEEETNRRRIVEKNYTIGKFKQHNAENHDVACKMKLKKHAINMLPKGTALKQRALEIDDKSPPRWRIIPAWTPPIPGFDPSEFMIKEE